MYNLALICQAVLKKKMFENNGHIHVYRPTTEAFNHLVFFSGNANVIIFPIQIHRLTKLTLP